MRIFIGNRVQLNFLNYPHFCTVFIVAMLVVRYFRIFASEYLFAESNVPSIISLLMRVLSQLSLY